MLGNNSKYFGVIFTIHEKDKPFKQDIRLKTTHTLNLNKTRSKTTAGHGMYKRDIFTSGGIYAAL